MTEVICECGGRMTIVSDERLTGEIGEDGRVHMADSAVVWVWECDSCGYREPVEFEEADDDDQDVGDSHYDNPRSR